MKKLLLTSAVSMILLASCGPTQNDAIKYNDHIMAIIDHLKTDHNLFLDQIDGHNIDSLKITHTLFADNAAKSLEESKKIEPFAGKKDFSDVTVEYFTALHSIANNEGKEMVAIMSKDSTQLTQADLDHIQDLAVKFDDSYAKVYDKITVAQKNFSKEWKFALVDK